MSQPWDPEANGILCRAIEIDSPEDRAAYLAQSCAGNEELRERVDRLLAAHQQAGNFLQHNLPARADATVPDRPVTEGIGTHIGPYKLLQEIGEGGFGVVYMAEQTQPVNRMVALKIIKPGMDTREVIARFEAERQALAVMDHPNIARVFDGGATESGRPYFVMELVKGIPLTDFCDQSKLDTRQRLELFATVCRAVQHAHLKGIIHRDLKPSNVMVTLHDGQPVPKVIDFGVSKAIGQKLTEKTMFTAYGQMIGTPQYMSPEQAEMSGLDVDTRSDIYSLGVLLYQLLTGTTPLDATRFRGQMFAELQRLIREEEAPRPSTRVSTLGQATASVAANRRTDARKLGALLRGELDWIVMKALEKDRSRRYETVSSFAADVQRYLDDEPVTARPPTAGYRLRKFARRHTTAISTSAVVAAALVVGTIVSTWQAVRATSAESKAIASARDAVRETKRATNSERELRDLQDELQERLYASDMQLASQAYVEGDIKRMDELLERHQAAATAEQLPGFEWYHLWQAEHCCEGSVRHPMGLSRRIAISPDGRTLAVIGFPRNLFLYDTATRLLLRPPLQVDTEWDTPCFSPDGSELVVAGPSTPGTYVFNTFTWEWATLESGAANAVAFCLVQDQALMATGGPEKLTIWARRDSSGRQQDVPWEPQEELPVQGTIKYLVFAPDGSKIVASQEDSALGIWDVQTREVSRPLEGSWGALALSPDGKRLAIENKDGTVRVWNSSNFFSDAFLKDASHRAPIATLSAPAPILSLALSPDGSRVVAGLDTTENTVVVWDVESESGQPLATIRGHSGLVWGVTFGKDAHAVWTSSEDRLLKVWTIDRCLPYDTWPRSGAKPQVGHIGVDWNSPIGYMDDNTIVLLDNEGTIQRWDVKDRKLQEEPLDDSHEYRGIAISDNGARLVGVTRDDELLGWDLASPRPTLSFKSHVRDLRVDRLAISRDGRKAAFSLKGSPYDHQIALLDPTNGQRIGKTIGNVSPRAWPTFSPHEPQLVLRRWFMPLYPTELWDVSGEVLSRKFAVGGPPDNCAAFTSDGTILALGSWSHEIRLHRADTGKLIQTLVGHNSEVWGLAFTRDGRRLVSTALDDTVRVWKVGDGPDGQWRLVSTLHVDSRAESIAVAPDGSSVAAARADGVLQVWRTASAQQVRRNVDRQLAEAHDDLVKKVSHIVFDEEVDPSEVAATLNGAFQEAPDGAFQRQFVTEFVAQQLLSQSAPRWENLAAGYYVLVGLKPNDPRVWLRAAALSVYTGNLDRYHQLCSEMLARFRETDDASVCETIAKACLISTPRQSDLSAIKAMADKTLTADPGEWGGWFKRYAQVVRALAEFRSGTHRDSIRLAQEALAESTDVPPWLDYLSPGVPALRLARAVAAMDHMRLGEPELASKEVETFAQYLHEHSPLHTGAALQDDWHDWLICEILQREITQETASLQATNESAHGAR